MNSPYTNNLPDAYIAAQASLGVTLTAIAWFRKLSWPAFALAVVAIWLPVLLPVEASFWQGLGIPLQPDRAHWLLDLSSISMIVAMLIASPRWIAVVAIGLHLLLVRAGSFFTDSDLELANLHLIAVGLLLGLHQREHLRPSLPVTASRSPRDYLEQDVVIFVVATVAAGIVSTYVLQRACDSDDEWGNTFQAAIFAKGRAYADVPPCTGALQNFWIFWKEGRLFAQYTPGWPLFCTPFQALGMIWLAGPVAHGLMTVGVARLGRRAVAGMAASPREVTIGGLVAAVAIGTGSMMLINGGSRFPHTFVCATFAWCVEALCIVTTLGVSARDQRRWGIVLGLAAAFMLSARPGDGVMLGSPMLLYFVYALAQRRVGRTALTAILVPFFVIAGLTLVILRIQLGEWFITGYSLGPQFHSWVTYEFNWPKPNEYKWPVPLATGSYCWWPCAPALGVAGMVACLGKARRIAFLLGAGCLALLVFYIRLNQSRGWDFGYGPRYEMPLIVPMAVGGAVVLAPILAEARRWSGGPAALVILAAFAGVLRIAPLMYPFHHEDVRQRNVVFKAARDMRLHDAIVIHSKGTTISDQLDLTQNLPLDLYPNPNVIFVSDRGPDMEQCLRNAFPGRTMYRTVGRPDVKLVAEP